MKRWVWSTGAALSLATAWAAADGVYQLLSHDLPSALTSGQTFIGHATWQVIEPGEPAFSRPVVDFSSTGPVRRGMRLPGTKLTPWSLPATQQPGDLLRLAFALDVPVDFPPGPASIALLLARPGTEGKGWQYASLRDPTGEAVGEAFRHALEVQASGSTRPMAPPLVVRAMKRPALDGVIQPEEWAAAAPIGAFAENVSRASPDAATRAFVGADDQALYLALDCAEPLMGKAVRNAYGRHDGPVWNNECVEVFLDVQGDRVSYVHFLVDLLNQRHDLLGSDSFGFNPAWRSAVSERPDGWSVEMALPFVSLGAPVPQAGEAWTGNFCRERKARLELSAWQPTGGSFAAPGRFGIIVFGGLKPWFERRLQALGLPDPAWPAAVAPAVAEWEARLNALRERFGDLDETAAANAFPGLNDDLARLQTDLSRLRLKAAALAGQGIMVAEAFPYERFTGEPGPLDQPPGPVVRQQLQDEWLDLAWNLTNPTDVPVTVRLVLRQGDPKAPWAHVSLGFPATRTLWRLATPVAAGDGRPVYDALVPLPAGTLTIAPGRTEQVWLSLLPERPADTRRTLDGRLSIERIDGGTAEPQTLPVSLTVLPARLRGTRAVHCFTWNVAPDPVASDPAWLDRHLQDPADHGVDVCMVSSLRHLPRVPAKPDGSLAAPLDFATLDALLAVTRDRFALYYVTMDIWEKSSVRRDLFGLPFDSPAYATAFKTWLAAVLARFDRQGIARDRLLLNPYDESVGDACQRIAAWIKEVDSRARVIIDASTEDLEIARAMDALTDVWVPHYRYHFAENHEAFFELVRQSGKPHWTYFYSEGSNDKAQDPTRHYLAKFWWAWQQGITGVCYWAQQYYGDPWYRAGWKKAYDTALVYPTEGGLVASRRWEAWRRGWQDYQILAMAQDAAKAAGPTAAAELRRRADEIVAIPGDPARAEAMRDWLRAQLAGDRAGTLEATERSDP